MRQRNSPRSPKASAQTLASDKSNQKRMAAALSILTDVARNDGWIEVMGPIDTGEIFLPGLGCRPSLRTGARARRA